MPSVNRLFGAWDADEVSERVIRDRVVRLEMDAWWRASQYDDTKVSYLYAIQGIDGGSIKLGRTTQPDQRLRDLSCASHRPLRILVSVPEWVCSEQTAHEKWKHLRHHGEWFNPDPDLLRWISDELPQLLAERMAKAERFRAVARQRESRICRASPFERQYQITQKADRDRERREAAEQRDRQRREVAEARAALAAEPCAICDDVMADGAVAFPGGVYVCRRCGIWLRSCIRGGTEGVTASYEAAIERAFNTLDRARQRLGVHQLSIGRMASSGLSVAALSQTAKVEVA